MKYILVLLITLFSYTAQAKIAGGKYKIGFYKSDKGCGDYLNKKFGWKYLEFKDYGWYLNNIIGEEIIGNLRFEYKRKIKNTKRWISITLEGKVFLGEKEKRALLEIHKGDEYSKIACEEQAYFKLLKVR